MRHAFLALLLLAVVPVGTSIAQTLAGGSANTPSAANLTGATLASGVTASSLTSVGALNAGSITSGFGAIDVGTDAISTTGALTCGTLTVNGVAYTFPADNGDADQVLSTNGSGTLDWVDAAGGGASISCTDNEVAIGNAGGDGVECNANLTFVAGATNVLLETRASADTGYNQLAWNNAAGNYANFLAITHWGPTSASKADTATIDFSTLAKLSFEGNVSGNECLALNATDGLFNSNTSFDSGRVKVGDTLHVTGDLIVDGTIAYTPSTDADWANPNPTTVAAALDRLAARVAAGGGAGAIP